ncbi:Class-II DAHP synthetase family protein [Theobroma cacao]|uniref:Phospho-2-dehydro-3-deoxyheptonate aldolase n=1 Tax=Theobroma cacao TaxID=3641 RepID=A0A061DQ18_THECC|nr:Class-II DAHP synthetase family protein [Theobroma cacao]
MGWSQFLRSKDHSVGDNILVVDKEEDHATGDDHNTELNKKENCCSKSNVSWFTVFYCFNRLYCFILMVSNLVTFSETVDGPCYCLMTLSDIFYKQVSENPKKRTYVGCWVLQSHPLKSLMSSSRPHIISMGLRSHQSNVKVHIGLVQMKTRAFDAILAEVRAFFDVHEQEGSHPGGILLEMTGQNVTECVGGSQTVTYDDLSSRYHKTV